MTAPWRLVGACLAATLLTATPSAAGAAEWPNTLALEAGSLSFSSSWDAEGPQGSGLLHRGDLDSDPVFGLSFEFRFARHVGVRAGISRGTLPITGRTTCPNPNCTFTRGPIFVDISSADWSVEEDGDLQMVFIEVPFNYQPNSAVELFAGPTIARLNLDGVESAGVNGLKVAVGAGSASYGLHLGGAAHLGYRRRWTVGVVVRWIPVDLDISVSQSNIPGGDLLTLQGDEDVSTASLLIGRRFGGRN